MSALIGWLGTLLGAFSTALALITVPSTWTDHHHAAYVLLWIAVIVCWVITTWLPVYYGSRWARFRWNIWHAGKRFDRKGPNLTIMPMSVWPMYPTGERTFVFETDREPKKVVYTPGQPAGLRITEPFEANVWEGSLPVRVQLHGKTIFRVVEFLPRGVLTGFLIADQAPGIRVEGEVSYSEYARMPQKRETSEQAQTNGGRSWRKLERWIRSASTRDDH